ncbi:Prefoldin [Acaromyces ingoldii]|uniref:Prefoldin n=1 Tax=Acaromyces ingoldii TaxID=215250 RepID=A0A316YIQ7_9BASI|nr:Prefoldin [Acaromyces ingoldii]PWN89089.1 Prefoldin [Acaromyces ingoldii]
MSATTATRGQPRMSEQQAGQKLQQLKGEMQSIATKIGELESDAEEHRAVIDTLREVQKAEPDRVCFRMIGGVLVQRSVKDVLPALEQNVDGLRSVMEGLAKQYKQKDDEAQKVQRELS